MSINSAEKYFKTKESIQAEEKVNRFNLAKLNASVTTD